MRLDPLSPKIRFWLKIDSLFPGLAFLGVGLLAVIVGCSKAQFEKSANPHCESDTKACSFDETIFVSGGMVDLLFVNDNSGSMSFEQSKMGQRFPHLLQKLDERMLDYRIGITTTDISSSYNPPRPINKNGALQNGRLIDFSNGLKFLTPNTPTKSTLFLEGMERQETLECENFIREALKNGLKQTSNEYQIGYYNHCPSGDERGIASALRAIRDNRDQMIRPEAHLALVVISDENERSWGLSEPNSPYSLQTDDLPQILIDQVKLKYPGKTFSVHSVVVRTGDETCRQQQNAQMQGLVKGQFGSIYEQLSKITSGIIGNVCEFDYGVQMGAIGAAIVKQVEYFTLHCENPEPLEVLFDPMSAQTSYHLEGRRVVFDKDLDPSVKVRFRYQCPVIE